MQRTRHFVIVVVLVFAALTSSTAEASCPGVMCGGYCGVEGFDFCIYVHGGDETNGCKAVGDRGCMSMRSLICCPRDPQG